jgi:hypothetical protein
LRVCRTCKLKLSEDNFNTIHSKYTTPNGDLIEYTHFRKDCKACHTKKKYERVLQTKYTLSLKDFQNILEHQNNECAICHISFNETKPYVDHCHTTNDVRGILCSQCNFGLGQFKDNVDFLLNAINYLKLGCKLP